MRTIDVPLPPGFDFMAKRNAPSSTSSFSARSPLRAHNDDGPSSSSSSSSSSFLQSAAQTVVSKVIDKAFTTAKDETAQRILDYITTAKATEELDKVVVGDDKGNDNNDIIVRKRASAEQVLRLVGHKNGSVSKKLMTGKARNDPQGQLQRLIREFHKAPNVKTKLTKLHRMLTIYLDRKQGMNAAERLSRQHDLFRALRAASQWSELTPIDKVDIMALAVNAFKW